MGVTVYLSMFFYFETGACVTYLQRKKEKEAPTCLVKRHRNSRDPKKIPGFGGGGAVIEGSLVSWCHWSQNTGYEGRVLNFTWGLLPNSAALLSILHLGQGNAWVPLCLPSIPLASRLSPERWSRSLQPCGL